jgi:hypothetical protein
LIALSATSSPTCSLNIVQAGVAFYRMEKNGVAHATILALATRSDVTIFHSRSPSAFGVSCTSVQIANAIFHVPGESVASLPVWPVAASTIGEDLILDLDSPWWIATSGRDAN